MNKKGYIFQKNFFLELFSYVLQPKGVIFTHDIRTNNECRKSSAVFIREGQRSKDRGESSSTK